MKKVLIFLFKLAVSPILFAFAFAICGIIGPFVAIRLLFNDDLRKKYAGF